MKIALEGQSNIVVCLSRKDVSSFEKTPFGSIATKAKNRGIIFVFSLGKEKSASIKDNTVSLKTTKEEMTSVFKKREYLVFTINHKNPFGISVIEIYLETD